MRLRAVSVVGLALLAATSTLALLPTASAGHEECDQYHYPELQRACRLANWWHWCLQQIWWGQPCVWIGGAAPAPAPLP